MTTSTKATTTECYNRSYGTEVTTSTKATTTECYFGLRRVIAGGLISVLEKSKRPYTREDVPACQGWP